MAKKSTIGGTKSSGLMDILGKIDGSAEILSDSKAASIRDYIPTGSYIVNALMTGSIFKGVPCGRVVTLAGDPATGKTYLALSICKQAQKKGYTPIYIDSEGAIDIEQVSRIGCDTSKFIIKQASTITEVSSFIANLCSSLEEQPEEERDKVILVLDSLGNLTSEKELKDTIDGSNKRDLTKQQEIKALFRVNATPLARLGIPFIVNTHTYTTTDVFAQKVVSGGCLIPTEEIVTSNGCVAIKDVKVGDYVLTEKNTYEKVLETYRFDKPTIKFVFEDATTLETSRTHKFLTTLRTDFDGDVVESKLEDGCVWRTAESIRVGSYVREIRADKTYGWLKIVGVEPREEKTEVCDITVENTHSYVTKNGVINHNSGINYNSSVTLMLSAAKLDDKASDKAAEKKTGDFVKTGVLVTAQNKKSRFTIQQKAKFQIPFFKAPNPYVGLEVYLTWENSGIIPGKIVTEKEYLKMNDTDKSLCHEMVDENGAPCYAYYKETSRKIVVKHLGCELPIAELWTPKVFTDDVLHSLDEAAIRPNFELPSQDAEDDLERILLDD